MSCAISECQFKVIATCISCQKTSLFCAIHQKLHQESNLSHQIKFLGSSLDSGTQSSVKKSNYKRLSSKIISSNSEIILNARKVAIEELKSLKNSKSPLNPQIVSNHFPNFLQDLKINETRTLSSSHSKSHYNERNHQNYNSSAQINIQLNEISQLNEVLMIEIEDREKTIKKLNDEKEELFKANQELNKVVNKLKKELQESEIKAERYASEFEEKKKESEGLGVSLAELFSELDQRDRIIEEKDTLLKNQKDSEQSATRL